MSSDWLDRSAPVRDGESLDTDRLSKYLEDQIPELQGPLAVEQFPGGFSNLTYLLRMGGRELVLRRPPFGAKIKSAHDMGREHRILSHLAPLYPKAPAPLVYCDDPSVLDAPFYVMERVQGVILRPTMPAGMEPEPTVMRGIGDALVDTLVELHTVDVSAAGLEDLGKPEGYVARQIAGWAKRYRNARTDDIAQMERVAAWLDAHQPPSRSGVLIHNDFKYDNVVLDAVDWTRIIAVLDWEMATLGDPMMDLGTSLGYWLEAGDPEGLQALRLSPTTLPGNPGRLEVAERYARATGHDLDALVFYYAYGLFKIAVIIQQIYARYQRGDTQDPRFARLIDGVRGCAMVADRAIELDRVDRLF